jgi:hypothetical protein
MREWVKRRRIGASVPVVVEQGERFVGIQEPARLFVEGPLDAPVIERGTKGGETQGAGQAETGKPNCCGVAELCWGPAALLEPPTETREAQRGPN